LNSGCAVDAATAFAKQGNAFLKCFFLCQVPGFKIWQVKNKNLPLPPIPEDPEVSEKEQGEEQGENVVPLMWHLM